MDCVDSDSNRIGVLLRKRSLRGGWKCLEKKTTAESMMKLSRDVVILGSRIDEKSEFDSKNVECFSSTWYVVKMETGLWLELFRSDWEEHVDREETVVQADDRRKPSCRDTGLICLLLWLVSNRETC